MDDLEKYLEFLFGGLEGYVYAPVKYPSDWNQKFFAWPSESQQLQDWIRTSDRDGDSHVYISPAIYDRPNATKQAVKSLQVAWVEFDGSDKIHFKDLPVPSAIVQSSLSTHLHCYWKIEPSAKEVVEDVNRRLTYYLDADSSGWDSTQLLRPPTTTNRKRDVPLPVVLASYDPSISELSLFDVAPNVKSPVLEVVDAAVLPDWKTIMKGRNLPDKLIRMVKMEEPPVGARSSFLTKLAYELAEEGMNHLEIISLLLHVDERVKKFEGRNDQLLRLTQIAELASHKVTVEESITVYTYDDILHRTKDLEWILQPWLHKTGMMIISGAPSVGKTQLGLQFTSSLSAGLDFLTMSFKDYAKHSIFFMSLEMDPSSLKYIVSHQTKALGDAHPSSFHIIDEEGTLTQYENFIDQTGATVVLVDSLTELLDTEEADNENKAARGILKWIRKCRRRYNCAFILIHHNRKATEGNKKPKGLSDLAGSFQFGKDSDTVVQLWEDAKGIEVSLVKCRFGKKEAFYVQRDPETLWFKRDDSITPTGQSVVKLSGNLGRESTTGHNVLPEYKDDNSTANSVSESSGTDGTLLPETQGDGHLDVGAGFLSVQSDQKRDSKIPMRFD